MGLDQRITMLTKREDDTLTSTVYWLRKVNCLQGYFEEKYQTQNCIEHGFYEDDIKELKSITDKILQNKEDHDYIESNLPPTQGFFYGSDQIDEWYFEDVKQINEIMGKILKTPNVEKTLYWCWY